MIKTQLATFLTYKYVVFYFTKTVKELFKGVRQCRDIQMVTYVIDDKECNRNRYFNSPGTKETIKCD